MNSSSSGTDTVTIATKEKEMKHPRSRIAGDDHKGDHITNEFLWGGGGEREEDPETSSMRLPWSPSSTCLNVRPIDLAHRQARPQQPTLGLLHIGMRMNKWRNENEQIQAANSWPPSCRNENEWIHVGMRMNKFKR